MHKRWIKYTSYLFVAYVVIGCAGTYNPSIERGATFHYRRGYPEVHFNAAGFLSANNKPTLNLAADIVYSSLIFKSKADRERAKIAIDYRAVNTSNNNSVASTGHKKVVIKKNLKSIINSQNPFIYQQQIKVPPGKYKVYFTVTDLSSDKKTTRIARASVPDSKSDKINLTSIRMLSKDMDAKNPHWVPLTTYSVGGQADSLMFSFQVTNNSAKSPLNVQAKLIRFQSDTTTAVPLFHHAYSMSSLQRGGILYFDQTVIQNTTRMLHKKGSVFIQFRFGLPKRGNYRFVVHSAKGEKKLFKARDFAIMSPYYPALKTMRELASPLIYLMGKKDYKKMMAIKNPDSLEIAVNRFWLKHIGNKQKALKVARLYYTRVEEANKQFSNYKEGWKTDRGYVYILYGPPSGVHKWHSKYWWYRILTWYYGSQPLPVNGRFYFLQLKMKSKHYPFTHWVFDRYIKSIYRNPRFFYSNYEQRRLWLTGDILHH